MSTTTASARRALALVKGFQSIGAKSGDIIIFEELMDLNSLFLTANADTVYYIVGSTSLTARW
jgi:hypothetical protein